MITRQGYRIEKDKVPYEVLEKLQVKKSVSADFADTVREYTILRESEKYYYLPRFYGIKNIGDAPIKIPYKNIDATFNGELVVNQKVNQIEVINKVMPKLLSKFGGILNLPCGCGKTVLALYILCQLKVKTLIIVHKSFLLKQWIERIKEFIKEYSGENAKTVGILQQNKVETDKDIVIGMLQTLYSHNYNREQLKDFGLIIADEFHHVAAECFCTALDKINAKYILGLSATINRKDGLTKILKWYFGDVLYKIKCSQNNNVEIFNINYQSDDKEHFKEVFVSRGYKQTISPVQMITNLTKIKDRNDIIINILLYYANSDRNIILLSDRVEHLKFLMKTFNKLTNDQFKTGLYIGSTKQKDREIIESTCKFIFASYSMAQEGLDIKRLDTLIMATPQKDIVQSIGRVMRCDNVIPQIIDISDNLSIFNGYTRARFKLYNEREYNIKKINFNKDDLDNYKNNFIDLFINEK